MIKDTKISQYIQTSIRLPRFKHLTFCTLLRVPRKESLIHIAVPLAHLARLAFVPRSYSNPKSSMSSSRKDMNSKAQVASKEKPHTSIFTEVNIDVGPSRRPPPIYVKDPRNVCFDDMEEVRKSDARHDTKSKEKSGCACLMM
ncbi:hypothetical protein OCU04_008832 [Sclerotinia nivalis]|uniref:Uncharacterized protein n=1 Tax=Sclerotinia nivalis TaxID=352851 RepID=A0A9X0AGA1_9HELO|nr:hypothetical protein OCU04_008832 [Sclerotinia nivalis]